MDEETKKKISHSVEIMIEDSIKISQNISEKYTMDTLNNPLKGYTTALILQKSFQVAIEQMDKDDDYIPEILRKGIKEFIENGLEVGSVLVFDKREND